MTIDHGDMVNRLVEALAASVATSFPTIPVIRFTNQSSTIPYIRYRIADESQSDLGIEDEYYTQMFEIQCVIGEQAQEYSGLDLAVSDILSIMSEFRQYWQVLSNRQLVTATYTTIPAWIQGRGVRIARSSGEGYFGSPDQPGPRLYGIQYFLAVPMQDTNI